MTVGELRAILDCYSDDTPVLDGKGYDLAFHNVNPTTVDVWEGILDEDGNETPTVGRALSIGRRF